jgi:hypothetical protein
MFIVREVIQSREILDARWDKKEGQISRSHDFLFRQKNMSVLQLQLTNFNCTSLHFVIIHHPTSHHKSNKVILRIAHQKLKKSLAEKWS